MTWLPPVALALDMLLADPRFLPHPVRGIGLLAQRLEGPARRLGQKSGHPVLAGGLALAALCLLGASLAALLCRLPGLWGAAFSLYLAWAGLALGGLIREGEKCLRAIYAAEADPAALPSARQAVQMLVSRDTSAMQTPDLYRSLAESLSENLNDAFAAPFFWLCLGGPALLWLYKTVSTLDSMWGYTNERFLHLGRAAAKTDDALAFVPARFTVALMLATAWLFALPAKRSHFLRGHPEGPSPSGPPRQGAAAPCTHEKGPAYRGSGAMMAPAETPKGQRPFDRPRHFFARFFHVPGWPGWRALAAQAKKSASPNAGWPMAAAAWLLGGRCGGPTVYEGKILEKPLLGPETGVWKAENCRALLRLLRRCGLLCLAFAATGLLG